MNQKKATNWEVLDEAHKALRSVVAGVPAKDWQKATPCADWSVTQVFQHAVGDQLAYAQAITGEGGPAENPFTPSGRLDQDAMTMLDHALNASSSAWGTIGATQKAAPTPLPQGELPPATGAGAAALDAVVHAWDIAMATGQRSPITPTMAKTLMPVAEDIVEPLRQYGAYAPAIQPKPGADEVVTLLNYLGRRADWNR